MDTLNHVVTVTEFENGYGQRVIGATNFQTKKEALDYTILENSKLRTHDTFYVYRYIGAMEREKFDHINK